MSETFKFYFQQEIHGVFDHFSAITGIRIAFFNLDSKEIIVGEDRSNCTYCQVLRKDLDFDSSCIELDKKMHQKANKDRKVVVYTCHGGMKEAVFPVYLREKCIGYAMIGQFRTSDLEFPFTNDGSMSKSALERLKRAYEQTPVFSKDILAHVIGLFLDIVELVISHRMIRVADNPLADLLRYMEENVESDLSLDEAAKLVYRSRSSLQHIFKKQTGKSFKQYQIGLKLAKAQHYFESTPDITVQEVAFRLGFNDPFYFSRLFKKYRGMSPQSALTECRKQLTK